MRVFTCLVAVLLASLAYAAERPNVVILLADDLGSKDIGCYGGPVKTPNIDRLAGQGVRFTDFYSGAPVCSPARATLLTGRQHMRTGVYTVIQDHVHNMHLLKRETTIASVLKSGGYDTVHVGKWHTGTPFRGKKKPWIDEYGFDHWFATDLNAAPSHRNPVNFWRNRKRVGKLEGYACQLVVDEAIEWLDKKRSDKPFFINVWFHEPHAPLAAPLGIVKQYGKLNDPAAIYSATIDNTDRAIGRLLVKLESLGELENTIVIYTSDHGSYRRERNGELRGYKGSLFEGGIRTPGIIFWPDGIKGGRVASQPSGAVDLLPTICGLAGVAPPRGVKLDGTDLSPLLTEAGEFKREQPLFWDSPNSQPNVALRDGKYSLVGYRAAEYPKDEKEIADIMHGMEKILSEELNLDRKLTRSELWQKCYNYECKRADWRKLRSQFVTLNMFQEVWCPLIKAGSGGMRRFELYDLANDPNQTNNVAAKFPQVFERLRKQAMSLHKEVLAEAVDWSASAKSVEQKTRIHRLKSTKRSAFDAFTYVNRIPDKPRDGEETEGFLGRVFSRLANQEGRVLLKAPPGMSLRAYRGYRTFMEFDGATSAGNCAACHTPLEFTDRKQHVVEIGAKAKLTPSLRNLSKRNVDIRRALLGKVAMAKLKQAGSAEKISEEYSKMRLSTRDIVALTDFLKLLNDVPDDRFRKLILDAKVLDTSDASDSN